MVFNTARVPSWMASSLIIALNFRNFTGVGYVKSMLFFEFLSVYMTLSLSGFFAKVVEGAIETNTIEHRPT